MSNNKNDINWITESIQKDDYILNAAITKLDTGFIFLLSSDGYKFGSISVSIPFKFQVDSAGANSAIIPMAFSGKNEILAKAFGERIAQKTNQFVMVIINVDESKKDILKESIRLIDILVDKAINK